MQLNLTNASASGASVDLADSSFGCDFNEALVHQVVNAYLAAARAGTHAQKTRAQVRGGGKKPWKQKGSGRARAGTSRSPIWRTGGKVFAAVSADYSQKVNKKMYRGALRSIMSELIRQNRLIVVDEFSMAVASTKELTLKLRALDLSDVLLVTEGMDEPLQLSSRNLYKVDVRTVTTLDPASLIGFDKVLMTVGALKKFEGMLA